MATKKEAIAKQKTQVNGKNGKTLDGCGRKPLAPEMEETLFQWIIDRRSNKLRVSRIMIMKKAKILYDEMLDHEASKFEATRGWLEKFMKHHGLSLRQRTSVAQKDPDQLINRIVSYLIQARRLQQKFKFAPCNIYAMDETPVWEDMVATTTGEKVGAKEVLMLSTGHEKARVTVCLCAKANGSKLKPFIVFKGAKREAVRLNNKFRGRCVVASSPDGWMNTELTLQFNMNILGSFSFGARRFVEQAIQSQGEPSLYNEWLSNVGIHQATDAGNLKSPTGQAIVSWILSAWADLDSTIIAKSFKFCGLNLAVDGNEDGLIHCLKEGQSCHSGAEIFQEQLAILSEPDTNPFDRLVAEDIDEATPESRLIDIDDEDEIEIF